MNLKYYLERIGISGSVLPNKETLALLQLRHLLSIPFENSYIQLRIPILLEPAWLYEKIVTRQRGGYCYELNGLFCELLKALGFDAHLISARITKGKNTGPEYDHLAIIVLIEKEQWLVDVGYGDFSLQPLLIGEENVQFDGRQQYLIRKEPSGYFSVGKYKSYDHKFHREYQFSLQPHSLSDFGQANEYKQTSPYSHFTQNLICTLPTDTGRISLINHRLIHTINGLKTEHTIATAEIPEILKKHLGIQPEAEYGAGDWLFCRQEECMSIDSIE